MGELLATGIFIAVLATGLMAGFFYAFSICVMAALAARPPAEAAAAMQSINRVVLNAFFLPIFLGTALLSIAVAVAAWMHASASTAAWTTAGAALYCLGTFAVTLRFNVPLNNALAALETNAAASAALWPSYLKVWTRWNHVRTLAALLSLACFAAALMP